MELQWFGIVIPAVFAGLDQRRHQRTRHGGILELVTRCADRHIKPGKQGSSVTGGRVYRGDDLPQFDGHYFYGDLNGWIRSFRAIDGVAYNKTDWAGDLPNVGGLVSFGSDSSGELYVVSIGAFLQKLLCPQVK